MSRLVAARRKNVLSVATLKVARFTPPIVAEPLERRLQLTSILVTNTADSGAGSFRQALIDANAASSADTISFDTAGTFSTPQTISLLTALPQISSAGGALTITGPGASNLTIRRDPSAAAFRVLNSATSSLTISGVTISGGNDITTGGGGLAVSGTTPLVTLDGVVFSGNATSEFGGAIEFSTAGYLSLRNSTVSGNTAGDSGGGIYFFAGGSFFIESTTISSNSSFGTEAGAGGGGLYFFGVTDPMAPLPVLPGTLVLRSSTINNNTAAGAGGGISLRLFSGEMHVQNSTVVQNTAATSGGAVVVNGGSGSLFVENSTVFGNSASSTAAGTGGGGLARINTTLNGAINVTNSVVSGDTNTNGPDIFRASGATTVNVNFSAVGSATGFVLTGGNNVAFGTNLKLGALANNGGPTLTMLPLFGSPLIEAGSKDAILAPLANDQRGPGFIRITDAEVDIGAIEQQSQSFVVTTNADSGAGSLRDAMTKALNNPASDTITFDPTFFGVSRTISLLSNLVAMPTNGGGTTIIGPGSSLLTVRPDPSVSAFFIFDAGNQFFNLSGMTISGGLPAIATSVLTNVTVTTINNVRIFAGGMGIDVQGAGALHISNSTITQTTSNGILFENGGSLQMENTTISQCHVTGAGGGLNFTGAVNGNPPPGFSQDSLVIVGSTISDNQATGNGGGVCLTTFTGTLLLQNSTIMFNAGNSGGGVALISGAGTITLQDCTMIGNTALASAANTGGGGIARLSTTGGNINLTNSVDSGNHNANGPDILRASTATTVNANFSAIGSATGFTTLSATSANNLAFGANLQFTVDHVAMGGSTLVVAMAPTSPLINAGSNSLAAGLATDQRGPGFARISDGIVDIGSVERQPYLVTTAADSGLGSLRNALSFADADPSADEIDFDESGVFATPQTISLQSQTEGMGNPLTIVGPGSSRLTIRRAPGAPNFRLFVVSTSVTISGATISGGVSTTNGGAFFALSTTPSIALDDVVLSGNSAGTDGGAISFTSAGFLAIRNSVISGNTAGGVGGAASMAAGGLIVVENSTISGNSAGGAAGGGAISFSGQATVAPPAGFISATLDIHNSTFNNNTASTGPGGAFALSNFTGTLQLNDSTFTANTAATSGGAAAIATGSGSFTVQDSTISGNTANGVAAGTGGGGLARTSPTFGIVTITNSVVSGDTNTNAPDILSTGGTVTTVMFSAIGSGTGFSFSAVSGNNLAFGTNLLLGALANNGGPTMTMLPTAGSPLINAGSNGLIAPGLTTDQRGGQFPRIQATTVDIGAVETPAAAPAVVASQFKFVAVPIALSFTFTQDVSASLNASDLRVQLSGDGFVSGILYAGYDAPTNTATFTLPQSLPDGNYVAQFLPGSVANSNGAVPSDFEFDFFALGADANHDRSVNALDFNALASNFGLPGPRTFLQGDFNYDGTVNTLDFNTLGTQFGKHLSPLAPSVPLNAASVMNAASPTIGSDLFGGTPIKADPILDLT